jgi:hypothetical protein
MADVADADAAAATAAEDDDDDDETGKTMMNTS